MNVRCVAAMVAGMAGLSLAPVAVSAEPVSIRQKTITHFDVARREAPQFGRLIFQGGLSLSGPRGFGGLSGLDTAGDRLVAVTDAGHWFTARMVLDNGRLTGLADTALAPRPTLEGERRRKSTGDAEAVTRTGDRLLVMVEQAGTLLSYPALGERPQALALPHAFARRARRDGAEALATLPDGRMVLIAEGRVGSGPIPALVGGRQAAVRRRGAFAVTGAAALPGGDLILVERRYDGGLDVGLRIRRIGADAVSPGSLLDGPVLLETDLRHEIDNMEGIAASTDDGLALTLLSDDNFAFFQRTLLLRFTLADPRPRPKPLRPTN